MVNNASRRTVWLCMAVFFVQPIQLGIWLSRVAEIKQSLDLSNSELSLALLGMPFGLLPSLYLASRLVENIGPRRTLLWLFPPMLIAGVLPGLATGILSLFAALFILGGLIAFSEVALNVFAARVEKSLGASIMNRAHGFWSLGIMAGSFIGVQMVGFSFPAAKALIIGGLMLLPALMFVAYILPTVTLGNDSHENAQPKAPIPKALFLIMVIVFGATIVEGAMIDWSAVYMRNVAEVIAGREGLAVTVFAGFVTIGRFIGDAVNNRYGPVVLARICIGSAIVGLIVLAVNLGPTISYIGFAMVGFGVSTIFPLGVSASAALSNSGEARNVSVMTFGALTGFLIGPPMIGFVAEATSLNIAFALLLPALIVSFILARRLSATT